MTSLSKKNLLIGLSDGSIFLINVFEALNHRYTFPINLFSFENKSSIEFASTMNNNSDFNNISIKFPIKQIRTADGISITQIAVDEMQSRLYFVQEKIGLTRCISLENCDKNTTFLSTINLQNTIQSIALDSWNGYYKIFFIFLNKFKYNFIYLNLYIFLVLFIIQLLVVTFFQHHCFLLMLLEYIRYQ